VRRTRLVGEQAELFPNWRYHAFVTDRVGTAVWLDQDHRRHAVVELCIRDLKAGVGLRHRPSGKFAANAAWLVIATLAHNLLRWIAQLGLGTRGELVVAKTLRRTLLALPGRLTARRAGWCRICPPAGRGRRGLSWPWRGCAASPTPPDWTSPYSATPRPSGSARACSNLASRPARILMIASERPSRRRDHAFSTPAGRSRPAHSTPSPSKNPASVDPGSRKHSALRSRIDIQRTAIAWSGNLPNPETEGFAAGLACEPAAVDHHDAAVDVGGVG
jgi:hypothetical protein